jgi:hypothetical protein
LSELKALVTQSKKVLRHWIGRSMPMSSRSRHAGAGRGFDHEGLGPEQLEDANRLVARAEQIVADWRNLMDRMAAEGRDVAAASELFQTFQADLEARRSNRDLIQRLILERRE